MSSQRLIQVRAGTMAVDGVWGIQMMVIAVTYDPGPFNAGPNFKPWTRAHCYIIYNVASYLRH